MVGKPFQPGQSGNPAGRPVGSRSVETLFREAIEKIAKDNPEVKDVERELVITLLAKAKKGDLKAMEMYFDRLYGKPKQTNLNIELKDYTFSSNIDTTSSEEAQ